MEREYFFCPECGSSGDVPKLISEWCPECDHFGTWTNFTEPISGKEDFYMTSMALGHEGTVIWAEYQFGSCFVVSLKKNMVPVPTYIYDAINGKVINPSYDEE
jgi:hypothetical protein